MAAEYAKIKYAEAMTYGNVAYDLGRAVPDYDLPARERIEKERVSNRVSDRAASREKAQAKQGVSLFSAIGFVIVAVLMVFVLLGNIRLTEISYSMKETRSRIAALEQERDQLGVKYETTFNLNELRAYAIENLGMTEAGAVQTISIANVSEDKAVILDGATREGVISKAASFLTSLLEYFR